MMAEVVLEGLPKNIEEATIQAWFFEEGDRVSEGDELVELSTGEGAVVIQSPASGILAEVYFDEGESVPKGELLCMVDNEEDTDDEEDDDDDDDDEDDDEDDEDDDEDEDDDADDEDSDDEDE